MEKKPRRLSGANIIVETLLEEGVDTVFGYPGGQVLHIYDALEQKRRKIRHILTAHEQGAAHAADGWARSTGKVGVVIATSGPGASNLVTGIATAYLDSVPMVAITGNVPTEQIGTDSFQEVDIADITMPITKHNFIVKDVRDLHRILREAFAIAREGRQGPVLVDIPKDVQTARCDFTSIQLPKPKKVSVSEEELLNACELIRASIHPFIYCGGGVVSANAGKLVKQLSSRIGAPIGCSLMGLSAIESDFEGKLGLIGMHGLKPANSAMKQADLIIAIGTRFSDRAIGSRGELVGSAKILQIDIDPAEVDKNIQDTAYVIGDISCVISKLIERLPNEDKAIWMPEISSNGEIINEDDNSFTPEAILKLASEYAGKSTVVTDVGQHQMWTAQYYPIRTTRGFLSSGGLGTMGYGMGAAIGASLAKAEQPLKNGGKTLLITGDGSFGMNLTELATAVTYKIPLVIIIMNNSSLGMVRQWQKSMFGRTSQSSLNRKTDFVMLAKAFGADGSCADSLQSLRTALSKAFVPTRTTPYVIDCRISEDETVRFAN